MSRFGGFGDAEVSILLAALDVAGEGVDRVDPDSLAPGLVAELAGELQRRGIDELGRERLGAGAELPAQPAAARGR